MNTLKIVMVGPRSVGKTSLLAGMYREMKPEVDKLGCTLWQDAPTAGLLNQRKQELTELATGEGTLVTGEVGIQASADERAFTFGFVLNGEKTPTLTLCFTDLPGGWIEGKDNHQKADAHLANSSFSLIAVDATALMEERRERGPGRYNEKINQPGVLHQYYLRSMETLKKNNHCVIFVLIRAESYSTAQQKKLMFQLLREAYEDLINDFKKNAIKAEVTSVETVGGVRFSKFIESSGSPTARFVRKKGHQYEPKDCEVPFRRLLHHATSRELTNRKGGFLGWLFDIFGANEKLKDVVIKLASNSHEKVQTLTH